MFGRVVLSQAPVVADRFIRRLSIGVAVAMMVAKFFTVIQTCSSLEYKMIFGK
jgi:hypothetical protein